MTDVTVTVAQKISAPVDKARAAITDPQWEKWLPFIKSAECAGTSAGSSRVCVMDMPGTEMDGYELKETILGVDADAGSLAYSIENPPMPLSNFSGSVVAQSGEDGSTTVVWTANFQADSENVEMLRGAIIGQYQAGIGALEAYASA
ncbi:MAG: SRPBCC family protein [Pseudomonadota bacterium]